MIHYTILYETTMLYLPQKIIMLGNSNVGKTSIVNRFIGDRFLNDYKATIGPDY